MIDLHCHILPAVDDGANSWEESLEMARIAEADGITDILATPHITPGVYDNDREGIAVAVFELNRRLTAAGIGVTIHVGADVHVDRELVGRIEAGAVPVVGDEMRYLMAELPHQQVPPNVAQLFYELRLRQVTPVITHPERNAAIQQDLGLLHDLVAAGALAQVTAGSLTGEFGPAARRAAVKMLERRLIHVIASDAHGTDRRRPVLRAGVTRAASVVGEEAAQAMVNGTPKAILCGDLVSVPEPLDPKSSLRFVSRLFAR
jgi:protein-tyrosine phosphatase